MERKTPEPSKISDKTSKPESEINVPTTTTPAPSLEEEEEDDEFEDISDEFSFSGFSIHHFQGKATPTHITQRLKQPLLPHDDEGDVLVSGRTLILLPPRISMFCRSSWAVSPLILIQACLTVWWIILRFMEDIPEPKSVDSMSQASSTISRHIPHRQGRRLSHLVGLDQVTLLHYYTVCE